MYFYDTSLNSSSNVKISDKIVEKIRIYILCSITFS